MSIRQLLLSILILGPALPLHAGEDWTLALHPGRNDFMLRIGTDSLDATAYIPMIAPPDSLGYPGMLFVHGFGQTKHADTMSASLWAGSGYVTLCYSVRGHGGSTGRSGIMGPAERNDLRGVIAFLRALPMVNPARIGVQGGSQGGLHVFWCAVDSLPVAAGTADVISPSWASDLTENGSYRTTLTFLLFNSSVRYAPVVDTLRNLLRADDHAQLRSCFAAGRDVDTSVLYSSGLPIAAFSKWQDHYFRVNGMISWFRNSLAPRYLYCGTGGHFSDNVLTEFQLQWGVVNKWHEHFVAGRENGITGTPALTLATSMLPADPAGTFSWQNETRADWPDAGLAPYRLYLDSDSLLSPLRPYLKKDSVEIWNHPDPSYSLDSALADRFSGPRFHSSMPRTSRRFITRPLQRDVRWIGVPRIHYFVRSESDRFPIHAQIFEVEESGESRLVNRVPLTVRDWIPGAVGSVDAGGLIHSHRFSRGSRIAVELTNIDVEARPGWGEMPFHLPMFRDGSATCYLDSARASYIEIPLDGDPVLRTVVADLRAESLAPFPRVQVTWTTRGECGNSGFRVMRRNSGGEEEEIGFVAPAGSGNSPGPLAYSFEDTTVVAGSWSYRVLQLSASGRVEESSSVNIEVLATGIAPPVALRFGLEQNYPNPFNSRTRIELRIKNSEFLILKVYDVLGREVSTLINEMKAPGAYTVDFDGRGLASGVYLCRMSAGSYTETRTMILSK